MMYPIVIREMVEAMTDYHGMKEGIATLKDLAREFGNKNLNDAIYDICVEKYFCQDCLEYAEPRKEKEGRPYGDTVVDEEMVMMICPECEEEVG